MFSTTVILFSVIMLFLINFANDSLVVTTTQSKILLTILFIYNIAVAVNDIRKRMRD